MPMQLGFLSGISGPVPAALGKLKDLAYLDLGGNMLTGSLPHTLPVSMIDLRMSANFLTGTIPASYGENTSANTLANSVESSLAFTASNSVRLAAQSLHW